MGVSIHFHRRPPPILRWSGVATVRFLGADRTRTRLPTKLLPQRKAHVATPSLRNYEFAGEELTTRSERRCRDTCESWTEMERHSLVSQLFNELAQPSIG